MMDAVRLLRAELGGRVPLIGFAGSPWTLATYMVEGGSSLHFARAKGLLYEEPRAAHRLLAVLADSVRSYLRAQVEAGAEALLIFDTWGTVLAPHEYRTFSLAYPRAHRSRTEGGSGHSRHPVRPGRRTVAARA